MSRGMVALLAAVAAGLPVLGVLAHGSLVWVVACDVAMAAGLVAYVTAAPAPQLNDLQKKSPLECPNSTFAPAKESVMSLLSTPSPCLWRRRQPKTTVRL